MNKCLALILSLLNSMFFLIGLGFYTIKSDWFMVFVCLSLLPFSLAILSKKIKDLTKKIR
jgi:hypothetical protein